MQVTQPLLFEDEIEEALAPEKWSNESLTLQETGRQALINQYREALRWLKGVSKKIHDTWIEETLAEEPEAQAARGNQLKVIYRNRRVTQ